MFRLVLLLVLKTMQLAVGNFTVELRRVVSVSNTLRSTEQRRLRKHTFGMSLLVGVLISCVHSKQSMADVCCTSRAFMLVDFCVWLSVTF